MENKNIANNLFLLQRNESNALGDNKIFLANGYDVDFYILFTEGGKDIEFIPELNDKEIGILLEPYCNDVTCRWSAGKAITIAGYAIRILMMVKK